MNGCRFVRGRLSAFLDRELPAEETRRVEEHLDGCAACRTLRDQLGQVDAGIRGMESPATDTEAFLARLNAQLDRAERPARILTLPRMRSSSWFAGAFAMAAAMLGLVIWPVSREAMRPAAQEGNHIVRTKGEQRAPAAPAEPAAAPTPVAVLPSAPVPPAGTPLKAAPALDKPSLMAEALTAPRPAPVPVAAPPVVQASPAPPGAPPVLSMDMGETAPLHQPQAAAGAISPGPTTAQATPAMEKDARFSQYRADELEASAERQGAQLPAQDPEPARERGRKNELAGIQAEGNEKEALDGYAMAKTKVAPATAPASSGYGAPAGGGGYSKGDADLARAKRQATRAYSRTAPAQPAEDAHAPEPSRGRDQEEVQLGSAKFAASDKVSAAVPSVEAVDVQPATVSPGGTALIGTRVRLGARRAVAVAWRVPTGELLLQNGGAVVWRAPREPGRYLLTMLFSEPGGAPLYRDIPIQVGGSDGFGLNRTRSERSDIKKMADDLVSHGKVGRLNAARRPGPSRPGTLTVGESWFDRTTIVALDGSTEPPRFTVSSGQVTAPERTGARGWRARWTLKGPGYAFLTAQVAQGGAEWTEYAVVQAP
jgi:hypothetical protein